MTDLFQELHSRHVDLLNHIEEGDDSGDPQWLADVKSYTEDLRQAGSFVSDVKKRNELRVLLNYWGNYIYSETGSSPNVSRYSRGHTSSPSLFIGGSFAEL